MTLSFASDITLASTTLVSWRMRKQTGLDEQTTDAACALGIGPGAAFVSPSGRRMSQAAGKAVNSATAIHSYFALGLGGCMRGDSELDIPLKCISLDVPFDCGDGEILDVLSLAVRMKTEDKREFLFFFPHMDSNRDAFAAVGLIAYTYHAYQGLTLPPFNVPSGEPSALQARLLPFGCSNASTAIDFLRPWTPSQQSECIKAAKRQLGGGEVERLLVLMEKKTRHLARVTIAQGAEKVPALIPKSLLIRIP